MNRCARTRDEASHFEIAPGWRSHCRETCAIAGLIDPSVRLSNSWASAP